MLCSFIFPHCCQFLDLSLIVLSVCFSSPYSCPIDNYWIDVLLYLWVPKLANVDLVIFKHSKHRCNCPVVGRFGAHGTSIFLCVQTDNNVPLPREWGRMLCCHGYWRWQCGACWDNRRRRNKDGLLSTRRRPRQRCQRNGENNDGAAGGSSWIYSVLSLTLPGAQDRCACL